MREKATERINPENIVVMHNGMDISEFDPHLEIYKLYGKYKIHENNLVILYVGRIIPIKGVEYLIKIIDIVVNGFNLNRYTQQLCCG